MWNRFACAQHVHMFALVRLAEVASLRDLSKWDGWLAGWKMANGGGRLSVSRVLETPCYTTEIDYSRWQSKRLEMVVMMDMDTTQSLSGLVLPPALPAPASPNPASSAQAAKQANPVRIYPA